MWLRSLHVTALSFALSHLVHAPCFLCPTAVAKRLTSSRWWISSDTIFFCLTWIFLTTNAVDVGLYLLFHLPQCQLFLSSWGPILHFRQLFLPSISARLSQKAGRSSPVGWKSHAFPNLLLGPQKGSQMKTQTRILDNRLYYTRKIELHRKGKKSRTVRITPILVCSSGSKISQY